MRVHFAILFAVLLPFFGRASVPPGQPVSSVFFQDDLAALDRDFAGLAALEKTVTDRGTTLAELSIEHNPSLAHLNRETDLSATLLGAADPRRGSRDDRYKGIPGFLWGFCLGGIGVYLVYRNIENIDARKRETRHAWVGLIFLGLFAGAVYILLNYADGLSQ
jgi:hypothetical protein